MSALLLLLLAAPAWATSITVTDTCNAYSVSNVNGMLAISCGGNPPPPPPPSGNISCPAYTNTIVLSFPYVTGSGTKIQTTEGMGTTDILVATFTTPPAPYPGGTPFIQITDNAPLSTGFVASMSTTPCTFPAPKRDTQTVSFTYAVKPSTTYYVNITGDSALSVKLTAR